MKKIEGYYGYEPTQYNKITAFWFFVFLISNTLLCLKIINLQHQIGLEHRISAKTEKYIADAILEQMKLPQER